MSYFFATKNPNMDWRLPPESDIPEMVEAMSGFQAEFSDFLDDIEKHFHPTFGLVGVYVNEMCDCEECVDLRERGEGNEFLLSDVYFMIECRCCNTVSPGSFTRSYGGVQHPENPYDAHNRMFLNTLIKMKGEMRLFTQLFDGPHLNLKQRHKEDCKHRKSVLELIGKVKDD